MGLRKTKIPFELQNGEELKPINGIPEYGITSLSRVVNLRTMTEVKPKIDGSGYLKVVLFRNKVRFERKVHRLVALHFIPNLRTYRWLIILTETKQTPISKT